MMILEQVSLARQMDMVFREIREELSYLTSGTVFVQIRHDVIGKFGVRHDPMQSKDGSLPEPAKGLTDPQLHAFRQMGITCLKLKKKWTHGEILFDFVVRQGVLHTSVQFESNYNMAALCGRNN